jgi:hypothetical protein
MSQHVIELEHKGKEIEVLIGWDRPLQRFFLVIEEIESEDVEPDEEYIYSNLNDSNLPDGCDEYTNLEYFKGILQMLGIEIPQQIFIEVYKNMEDNVGNRDVTWNKDGTIKSIIN